MSRTRLPLVVAAVAAGACAHAPAGGTAAAPAAGAAAASAISPSNPFLVASTLPYQAPPFDRIRNEDYQPALEEGMRRHLAEIESIASQSSAPTFDNSIAAMERSGALLTRVSKVFFGVVGANTNDTLQKVQTEEAPRLAAHSDAIYLNDRLFQRVKSIYDRRESLGLTPEQKFLVERYQRDFVRAGAQLSEADKAHMRALNEEESKLTTDFQNRLLAATKAGAVVVDDAKQLDGLSAGEIAAAAEAATQRGLAGKWVIALQNTTQQPLQASLKNRALRERLFVASTTRAEHGDSTDTRAVIARLAQLRAEKAKLLGYPTYAAYRLADQGAKTPENATALLSKLAPAATSKARGEAAAMQALIDKQGGGFKLQPWDWQYYAEQVRKAQYDLDESQIKPYFELNDVLQNGVFYAANRMYGITFKERKDIPVYQPDVRVFEVFDKDGAPLALWYCDYFKRDNKNGGAWMDNFVDQSALIGTKPVVYNVANFQKPAPGQPALLTFDDVTTMFHEFGHALHGMFSHVQYPTFSGANTPRDFVEFPSQFNEHWALEPSVFAHYAKHYQTGAPIPASLVEKIKRARTFNQGFATTEYLAASLLDLAWHSLPADASKQNVDEFEQAALQKYGVAMAEVPPRYRTSYFAHIWGSGYSAGYYAYMWSEVLDDDAYAWFMEHGGMTAENGQRYRDMILSRGGTEEASAMYRAFAGRDPRIEPLMEQRGLVTVPAK
ncbi:MAG TPA: peptidyl-dipeptidase Dcp [Gemmatimonadaceae bacterium]|nr:peptidyl-dipeptidase Dcp [Gemmatimonadaceae bacterium]